MPADIRGIMKRLLIAAALVLGTSGGAWAQAMDQYNDSPIPDERSFQTQKKEQYGGLAQGVGREEVFYLFDGCKLEWIKQQKLTRTQWDMAVDKMAIDCKLGGLDPEEKELVVNYLTRNYGRFGR